MLWDILEGNSWVSGNVLEREDTNSGGKFPSCSYRILAPPPGKEKSRLRATGTLALMREG